MLEEGNAMQKRFQFLHSLSLKEIFSKYDA